MRAGGEFIRTDRFGNEHVYPNQFTIIGAQQVLKGAFWGEAHDWFVGLCAHNPADSIALTSINEPSALNGYVRQAMTLNVSNWPTVGTVNGESYVETREFTFNLSGPTSIPVNRLFLTDGDYVIAVSSPIGEGIGYLSEPYTNKYRLYLR